MSRYYGPRRVGGFGSLPKACSLIIPFHGRSDAELRPRQYALYTIARLVEAHEAQANHVRSCGIMPTLLDLIKGGGEELFDSGAFSAGSILQILVQEDDIPAILELSCVSQQLNFLSTLTYVDGSKTNTGSRTYR